MKKIKLSFHYIIFSVICQFFLCSGNIFAINTNNFFFDKFEADYYLEKTEDGASKLKVVENLTAVFPDYNQNKGICRMIPFTNQGGKNITLKTLNSSNLSVRRNGESEPIYSLEKTDNYFEVCTGTEEYLTGAQTYTFEYSFENVVTEFSDENQSWQELYWNTNGTGWQQPFGKVIARVHLPNSEIWEGESWCYVGAYGESGQERCQIQKTDGETTIEFTAESLKPSENLTFNFKLKPSSFVIKETPKSYLPIILLIVVVMGCILLLLIPIKQYRQTSDKRKYYKHYFIKPEYQPHAKYSLTELAQIYLGHHKDEKVPLLLDMVVNRRISLIKGEQKMLGGHKWSIKILDFKNLKSEEKMLLELINGGEPIDAKEPIEIQPHTAGAKLVALGQEFSKIGMRAARQDQLIHKATKRKSLSITTIFLVILLCGWFLIPAVFTFLNMGISAISGNIEPIINFFNQTYIKGGIIYVWTYPAVIIGILVVIALIITWSCLANSYNKFKNYTEAGLEASRYLDGLKLYIKMAEKDRLELLQSVKGADASPQGVVNLYEKLLPYAALFGLEKSWTKELEKYYVLKEVTAPDWYMTNNTIIYMELSRALRNTSTFVDSSTHHYSSTSSSGGSGFSGSGGGGFSGGGGGGGGGGGR